jgi:hypothetical protein
MILDSEAGHSPTMEFPVSDDDAMDVVKSDEPNAVMVYP